jgi:hypothetical protein
VLDYAPRRSLTPRIETCASAGVPQGYDFLPFRKVSGQVQRCLFTGSTRLDAVARHDHPVFSWINDLFITAEPNCHDGDQLGDIEHIATQATNVRYIVFANLPLFMLGIFGTSSGATLTQLQLEFGTILTDIPGTSILDSRFRALRSLRIGDYHGMLQDTSILALCPQTLDTLKSLYWSGSTEIFEDGHLSSVETLNFPKQCNLLNLAVMKLVFRTTEVDETEALRHLIRHYTQVKYWQLIIDPSQYEDILPLLQARIIELNWAPHLSVEAFQHLSSQVRVLHLPVFWIEDPIYLAPLFEWFLTNETHVTELRMVMQFLQLLGEERSASPLGPDDERIEKPLTFGDAAENTHPARCRAIGFIFQYAIKLQRLGITIEDQGGMSF